MMETGRCIHYNGIDNSPCRAGHKYLDVAIPLTEKDLKWHSENYPGTDPAMTGIIRRLPCFAENGITTCPDYREPTPEEIKARDEEITRLVSRVGITRAKIVEHIKASGQWKRNWGDKIPCPICQNGTVHFSYAGNYNGHIHAKCTTAECVQWIE